MLLLLAGPLLACGLSAGAVAAAPHAQGPVAAAEAVAPVARVLDRPVPVVVPDGSNQGLAAAARRDVAATLKRLQRRMLVVVNLARAVPQTCGKKVFPAIGPLTRNKRLDRAAQRYARKMAHNDWFDHDAPDGADPGTRITAEGYHWSRWGENIGAGYDGVLRVVTAWLASPGHCRTLMGSYRHVGFGHSYDRSSTYGHYWVQDFANPR